MGTTGIREDGPAIILAQVEALGVGQRLKRQIRESTLVMVIRRMTGYEVEGLCQQDAARRIEEDFRATDWAPAGVVYLWSRRTGLSAAEALDMVRRTTTALEVSGTPAGDQR